MRDRRRIAPGTVLVTVAAVLLTFLLVVAVHRGVANLRTLESARPAGPTPAATSQTGATPGIPGGADASEAPHVPLGASEAATRFVKAWLDPNPKTRGPALEAVTTPGLAEQLAGVDPTKIPKARAVGSPRAGSVSAYSATLRQRLSDKSTIQLELAADPEARYGWLVYMVSPGDGI